MAEELKVEPDHLDGAATKLQKLSDDNAHTETYLKQWLDLPSSEGGLVLQGVIETLQEVLAQLQANYKRLGSVTSDSATELTNAGKMYRTTDRGFAASLDRTYVSDGEK
ncbi:type VII secretion target [Nocardia takedensis]|uniref:type VII secretion target n=1 Tax=Nocardia takedensis TaxID=259390 RepID=UPI00030484CB|nr:type VII secretion target [Nocardia takedensis]